MKNNMTYEDAYNYLISLSNIPRTEYMKDSKHCDIYIKRLNYLLKLLGNPQNKIPHYVHITGTSGKGSCALMCTSILKESGFSVGTITSPHASSITERWEINKKEISKKDFIFLIEMIKPILDEYVSKSPYELPSFFEITTALGLYYFALKKVDYAVIEVGLGGRYDSTNVIPNKDICLITNIGDDHKNIIGPTKFDICKEKSGIIKKGCSVYTTERKKKFLEIFNCECRSKKAELNIVGSVRKDYKIIEETSRGIIFIYKNNEYFIPVSGKHQISNAILVIETMRDKKMKIDYEKIYTGLKLISLPLRMETVSINPLVILDGAHNKDKIKSTVNAVKKIISDNKKYSKINLVVGFANDKEWPLLINNLLQLPINTIYCSRFSSNIFRTIASPRKISDYIKKRDKSIKTKIYLDPIEAYTECISKCKKNEVIVVTGSIFLSGQIRQSILQ